MARTKASVGAKVSSGKSSKARSMAPTPPTSYGSSGGSEKSSRSYSRGNPVCPRETPIWQKPITNFLTIDKRSSPKIHDEPKDSDSVNTKKSRINVIESDEERVVQIEKPTNSESDEEMVVQVEKPTNSELDDTLELEPLNGENSHKVEEYFPKLTEKNKGKGKKSNKENFDANRKSSLKRDLDASGSEENASKKAKV